MTFEQTRDIIVGNRNFINNVCRETPVDQVYNFLVQVIELVEHCDRSKITDKFISMYGYTIRHFIDIAIKSKLAPEDKTVLTCISDLLFNLANAYNIKDYQTELNALCFLTEAARSLEDILVLLLFMFNKLSNNIHDESTSSFISRKYYTELSNYLSSRSSHDDKYDL